MIQTNALTKPFDPFDALDELGEAEAFTAGVLRNQVRQIVVSYHHTFDVLYEAVQNAVDGCAKAFAYHREAVTAPPYVPKVDVTVDLDANAVEIVDNGLGMTVDTVKKYFFTPYSTLKVAHEVDGNFQFV